MNSFPIWKIKGLNSMPKKKSLFCLLSFFLSLSLFFFLFPWDAFDIYFSTLRFCIFSFNNLLYLDLKHNFYEAKDDVQGEKNQKEKALHYVTVSTGKSVKITSFLKKYLGPDSFLV